MPFIVFKAKIKDFDQFKEAFAYAKTKRHEAGITEKYVLHGIDDRNEIVLVLEARDMTRAKAYYDSSFLKDAMKRGGITGAPEIHFYDEEREVLAKVSGL